MRDIGPQYTQTELFWFRVILSSHFVALIAITGMGIGYAIWFRDELKNVASRFFPAIIRKETTQNLR